MSNFQTRTDFEISHRIVNDENVVTITPSKYDPKGVKPVELVFTPEQWDSLRYHFVTAVNDRLKITKLAYIF